MLELWRLHNTYVCSTYLKIVKRPALDQRQKALVLAVSYGEAFQIQAALDACGVQEHASCNLAYSGGSQWENKGFQRSSLPQALF